MKQISMKIATFLCVILMICTAIVPIQAAQAEEYYWPVPNSTKISNKYTGKTSKANDYEHWGIDITGGGNIEATKSGTVIKTYTGCNNVSGRSSKSGVVCKKKGGCKPSDGYSTGSNSYNFCNYGYGNGVIIRHDDNTYSMYAHLKSVSVNAGQYVNQGDVIGIMGSSGSSTGEHLHFELAKTVSGDKTNYKDNKYIESKSLINPTPGKINYLYELGTPVTLNYCDDKGSSVRVSIPDGTTVYGKLPDAKYPGYLFQGWFTEKKGGTKITASTSLISTESHNLYAQWKACSHKNGKNNAYSGGICGICGHEYNHKITAWKTATPYKVIKKDSAPVWSRPYSNNAVKLNHIKNGSIVMIVAQTTNQAGNIWYMLSDGSWIYSENVKKASASNVYYVYNTTGCLMINKAANSKNPISQIPEGGAVIVNTSKSTKSWLYVTYNGVSGYAYKNYLTTSAPQISIYQCNENTNILESKKSNAKSRGTIPSHTEFVVFTNRTTEKDSYYAVYYNNEIAGYIPKKSAVKTK